MNSGATLNVLLTVALTWYIESRYPVFAGPWIALVLALNLLPVLVLRMSLQPDTVYPPYKDGLLPRSTQVLRLGLPGGKRQYDLLDTAHVDGFTSSPHHNCLRLDGACCIPHNLLACHPSACVRAVSVAALTPHSTRGGSVACGDSDGRTGTSSEDISDGQSLYRNAIAYARSLILDQSTSARAPASFSSGPDSRLHICSASERRAG